MSEAKSSSDKARARAIEAVSKPYSDFRQVAGRAIDAYLEELRRETEDT